MMMNTLSGSTVLPILLLSLLNGLSGHPIGERLRARQAASPPESRNMVHMQNVLHDNNCTAARQAERDNTHDIACLLETFNQQVRFTVHACTYYNYGPEALLVIIISLVP